MEKVGILKFRTKAVLEASEWQDVQTWQEHKKCGLLVCIDCREFERTGNYTPADYTFKEITE